MSDITWYRGDTFPIQKTVTDEDGNILDITGWTLTLTINHEEDPADTSEQIAEIVGTITDGSSGEVEFAPAPSLGDYLGTFFYDIQAIDALGSIATNDKGRFIILQDVTKQDEEFIWTPNASLADGTVIPTDGSQMWWQSTYYASDQWTKETRDALPVARWHLSMAENSSFMRELHPFGPDMPRPTASFGRGFEFEILIYLHLARCEMLAVSPGWWDHLDFILSNVGGGDPTAFAGCRIDGVQDYPSVMPTTGWGSDWFRMAVRVAADGACAVRAWIEGGAEGTWYPCNAGEFWNPNVPYGISVGGQYVNPDDPAARLDLAEFIYRRLT